MTQEPEQQDFERAAELFSMEMAKLGSVPCEGFEALTRVAARQCMRERLAVDLTLWAQHKIACDIYEYRDAPCTCGLSDALAGRKVL